MRICEVGSLRLKTLSQEERRPLSCRCLAIFGVVPIVNTNETNHLCFTLQGNALTGSRCLQVSCFIPNMHHCTNTGMSIILLVWNQWCRLPVQSSALSSLALSLKINKYILVKSFWSSDIFSLTTKEPLTHIFFLVSVLECETLASQLWA